MHENGNGKKRHNNDDKRSFESDALLAAKWSNCPSPEFPIDLDRESGFDFTKMLIYSIQFCGSSFDFVQNVHGQKYHGFWELGRR